MVSTSSDQLNLFSIEKQQVTVSCHKDPITHDAGLLSLRAFDKRLGILLRLADKLPDPRDPSHTTYSTYRLLTQRVYQILAGYPDANDADHLQDDPLWHILQDISPDQDGSMASGSTLNRFHYGYTRKQSQSPDNDDAVLAEIQHTLNARLKIGNDYLVELFIDSREQPPSSITIDLDGTDDPVHGNQHLSSYHGYYGQHQYFPLLAFDGETGFPLAAWLRPGTAHASWGAVDTIERIVKLVRAAWPEVAIFVRGDTGFATPELYQFCEDHGIRYALGYGSNDVLLRKTDPALQDLQLYYDLYGHRSNEPVQRFERLEDYQAGSWSQSRSIIAKIEINEHGSNRRFVVSNLPGSAGDIYRDFYVQRGNVPEKPIGEFKNGLDADRLSQSGFRANGMGLLEHALAYALVVLYREAASEVEEVATAEVGTLRRMLWKVCAVVKVSARRIAVEFSGSWPGWSLWRSVHEVVMGYVDRWQARGSPVGAGSLLF